MTNLKDFAKAAFIPGVIGYNYARGCVESDRPYEIREGFRKTPQGTLKDRISDGVGYTLLGALGGFGDFATYILGYGITFAAATGINLIGLENMENPDYAAAAILGIATAGGRGFLNMFYKGLRDETKKGLEEAMKEKGLATLKK